MFTTFADPKTDFIFKRIFGTEANKHLLVPLLNSLLELEGQDRIQDVTYLTPEQSPPLPEMKLSVVDVKCRDELGRAYIIEMQVLNVDGFEKRMVYNASKAYVMQLPSGEDYRSLAPVIGVTICDFVFWSTNGDGLTAAGTEAADGSVPMLSRWRMHEQASGARSFSDIQYCFFELPKYSAGSEPVTSVDRWAYFFREAEHMKEVPPALQDPPYCGALEVARTANLTPEEWELYDRAKVAEQDARGALTLARREGLAEGKVEGLRHTVEDLCQVMGLPWSPERKSQVEAMGLPELEALRKRLLTEKRWLGSRGPT